MSAELPSDSGSGAGPLSEGDSTADGYRWICPRCFDDFRGSFGWTLIGWICTRVTVAVSGSAAMPLGTLREVAESMSISRSDVQAIYDREVTSLGDTLRSRLESLRISPRPIGPRGARWLVAESPAWDIALVLTLPAEGSRAGHRWSWSYTSSIEDPTPGQTYDTLASLLESSHLFAPEQPRVWRGYFPLSVLSLFSLASIYLTIPYWLAPVGLQVRPAGEAVMAFFLGFISLFLGILFLARAPKGWWSLAVLIATLLPVPLFVVSVRLAARFNDLIVSD